MAQHGGQRPGAGRPPKAERYAGVIADCEDRVRDRLPDIVEGLILKATSDNELVAEEWAAAGTVKRKELLRAADGSIWLDEKGKPASVEVQVFPDLPPEQLVLVKRKVTHQGIDVAAAIHCWDRLGGKPAQEDKPEDKGLDIASALDEARRRLADRRKSAEAESWEYPGYG